MALLILKNIATFLLLLLLLAISLISIPTARPPVCEVYSDGLKYFSCAMVSDKPIEDLNTIKVPWYYLSYIYILITLIIYLWLCFVTGSTTHPLVGRNAVTREQVFIDPAYEYIVDVVVKLIRSKTDLRFVIHDVAKHLLDIVHMIAHCAMAYTFSFHCALNMGYSAEEAKYEFFPSVYKCKFDHWPFRGECEVNYGFILKGIFMVLWLWFTLGSILVFYNVIYKIWNYFKGKNMQKFIRYTSMDDWLVQTCQDKATTLNNLTYSVRMNGFQSAARRLVTDPRIRKYLPDGSNLDIELDNMLPNNEMGTLEMDHPLTYHHNYE